MEDKNVRGQDWTAAFARLGIYLLVVGASIVMPGLGGLLVVLGGLYLLVCWHNDSYAFRCQHCDSVFEISVLHNFVSPHGVSMRGTGWKYLKCPTCGQWSRAAVMRKSS